MSPRPSSLGNAIPAQTIELGKAVFGPELSYRIALPDWRMTIEPFAFIRGEYDFVRNESTTLGTTVIRPQRWGARAGGGLALTALDRVSLRVGCPCRKFNLPRKSPGSPCDQLGCLYAYGQLIPTFVRMICPKCRGWNIR